MTEKMHGTAELRSLSVDALQSIVTSIFLKAGLSSAQAAAVARTITAGERDNCKSHGIYRIEGNLRTLKAGKVKGQASPQLIDDGTAVLRADAAGGFSPLAFEIGAPALVARARQLGLAALVINDCTHFSALWPEIEVLTDQGLAALAMCPSYASVAPTGGTRALLGTNPFAFGWPRPGQDPYVFDFATSAAARGEIELHRRAGKSLPEGWAINSQGVPTTDPEAALEGSLLPFGSHKGSAISTMIELLGAAMIGDLTSLEARETLGSMSLLPRHGELLIAFDPLRFASRRGDPFVKAEIIFAAILDQGARMPSQRRYAARRTALKDGIALTVEEYTMLDRLAAGGLDAIA